MALEPIRIDPDTLLRDQHLLPPLPGTLERVLSAIQNRPGASSNEVADHIGRDPAMVAHILKVVNSAYYSVSPPITNLRHAIAYLGLNEIARIALALSVIHALEPEDGEQAKSFWLHSYLTAVIAKLISRRVRGVYDIDDLYSAALLHDIGKLVYQRLYPNHYREMLRYCEQHGCFLIAAEAHYELPSHLTFGVMLSDRWRLPKAVRRAAEFHELPHLQSIGDPDHASPLDVLITVANLLACLLTESLNVSLRADVQREVKRVLSLGDDQFLLLMGDVYSLRMRAEETIDSLLA
ncbi:MAG: HDOD domain-containing protein [Planctomycetota bacterium]